MINRRAFLVATSSAAATIAAPTLASNRAPTPRAIRVCAPFAAQALASTKRINAALGNAFQFTIERYDTGTGSIVPREDFDIVFTTLDAVADLHPGFAYFAGLPGRLGMPDAERLRWMTTASATLWHELQTTTGFTCLPAGNTRHGADLWSNQPITCSRDLTALSLACDGVPAKVLSGLGVTVHGDIAIPDHRFARPSGIDTQPILNAGFEAREDRPYCAPNAIAQHGRSLMLVMRRRAWEHLSSAQRDAFMHTVGIHAPHPAFNETITWSTRRNPLPAHIANVRDRVTEAVVADLSTHDALTRRINELYFAALRILTA